MRNAFVVVLWGLLLCGLYFSLGTRRVRPATSEANAVEQAPVEALEPSARTSVNAAPKPEPVAEKRAPAPASSIPAAAAKPEPQTGFDPAAAINDSPTPAEEEGKLSHLYARFRTDPVSAPATHEAEKYFKKEFDAKSIAPTAQHISCTDSLCRSRFSFPDFDTLRRLAKLERDANTDVAVGDPLMSEEGATIVIYFPTSGHVLPAAQPAAGGG